MKVTNIKIIEENGKRYYENKYGYINCYHNDKLIKVVTSSGNKSFICSLCGEIVKKEVIANTL